MDAHELLEHADKVVLRCARKGSLEALHLVRGQQAVYKGRDDYYGGKPAMDTVIFKEVPTSANRVGAENSATSGDLQLLVYETTEAIPTGGSAAAVLCAVPLRHVYARLPADG